MSATTNDEKLLPELKRVLLELRDTRRRLEELEDRDQEPIAIVGMGCRFPGGADTPEALWKLVDEGRDAIGPFPDGRFWDLATLVHPDPDHAHTTYARGGGFIYDADRFDPGLFSIAPREALAMDPQQRLLLEAAWEALEDSGIAPDSLRGSDAGVFIGVSSNNYGAWPRQAPACEGFHVTGMSPSVASGRISYTFGLEGQAVSIDTACSSSLVALHLACRALRRGESELALAGGSTIHTNPGLLVDFARQRVLSPDGRCKAFGATADGAGFSDGVGVVVLERLSRARAQGHEVLAVIRGSAVNQDGASNGLTAPNGPSQVRVIREALADAGLSAADVDAVEAHGTGTPLGDPIEAQALLETYGQGRANGPLHLGSIKSNIGHSATAAGVAGVIKMVQALRHERLPKSLYCEQPSPHVDWSTGAISLLKEPVDWPRGERPRRAGVSSFAISGTNVHLILEEAPAQEAPAEDAAAVEPSAHEGTLPFVVSGAGEAALAAQADRLASFLEQQGELDLSAVARALALQRAQLPERAAIVTAGREELIAGLRALAAGEQPAQGVRGRARSGATAFLFTGQGAQWAGMGAGLYERFAVFAEALDAVCAELDPLLGRSLKELMFAAEGSAEAALLDRTELTQPALFAFEVAQFRLFEHWGVRPDFLIGHSVGELAAAHVAGMLSLSDACALVAARGRLMGALPEGGAMVAIEASEDEVVDTLADGGVSIAAVNGPRAVVVSGEVEAVEALEQVWIERGRRTSRLRVSHAFHSHLMEPMLDELRAVAGRVTLSASRIPIVSNLTGETVSECDATYWARHVREPVRFAAGIAQLEKLGVTRFVEVGPDAALTAMAQSSVTGQLTDSALFAAVGRKGRDQEQTLLTCLAAMHAAGVAVNWGAVLEGASAQRVELPTYAFQRERFWAEAAPEGDPEAVGQLASGHPLLGASVQLAGVEGWLLTGRLSLSSSPWLADHAIGDTVLLPGTAFVELALAASEQVGAGGVEDLTLVAPLVLTAQSSVSVQVSVAGPDEDGRRQIDIYCAVVRAGDVDEADEVDEDDQADGPGWELHATGALAAAADDVEDNGLLSWPPAGAEEIDVELFYETLAEAGYRYGPAFQGLRAAWRDGDAWLAEIALPEALQADAGAYGAHPALLDAALHTGLLAALEVGGDIERPAVPFSFAGVRLHGPAGGSLRVKIEHEDADPEQEDIYALKLSAADAMGQPVLTIGRLQARELNPALLAALTETSTKTTTNNRPLYEHSWIQLAQETPSVETASVEAPSVETEGTEAASAEPDAPLIVLGEAHADVVALEQAIAEGAPTPKVVVAPVPDGDDPHAATTWVLELLQAWLASEPLTDVRLAVLTKHALAVADGDVVNLAHAGVPGLVRSAATEHPLRFALVDFGEGDIAAAVASAEPEIALRDGGMFVPRLVQAGTAGALVPPEGSWRLGTESAGSLDGLTLLSTEAGTAELGEGEVRVAVQAAGLNFRDVLIALGMYPGQAPLGSEGAGVVAEVGPGVERLKAGDRVLGFMPDGFGTHAVTDARLLVGLPEGWSWEEAAAMPTVFLTAYYGLVDIAKLQRGERVLIHAAAGGVGQAAVQIAQEIGAEVFATAHPDKWDTLRGFGLDDEHIASSRDLAFREAFGSVDVVLDSLAGEFVDASLALLGEGGRFVEIGKADVREPDKVAAEHPGVTYRAFDLLEAGADRLQVMLVEILERFAAGDYRHLPISTWDVRRGPEAFRFMREAKHIGKIVLTVPQRSERAGTVLITGGTGGLGALVARHLASEHGVERLVLTSRRGLEAEGAAELVAELAELGSKAEVVACDVADRAQVEALLSDLPLTGIVHAAGVLEDGIITSLDAEQMRRVMAPKVDGALHLHELTADRELSFFVLFSSAAAALGAPGQGNYAAANGFLDGLAHYRQAQGLAATSVGWGAWDRDTGIVTADERSRVARMGVIPLPDEEGLALLDAALSSLQAHLVAIRFNTGLLRQAASVDALPPLLTLLVRASGRRGGSGKGVLKRMLAAAPESDWHRIALDLVRGHIAAVLGHASPQAVDPEMNFKDMGFDSLAAVELRNRLIQATGLSLPVTVVFDHPTPTAVAGYLVGKLAPGASKRPAIDEELDKLDGLLRAVADDDTDRVRRRLRTMLAGLGEEPATEEDEAAEQRIESASADEILALINEELERS